MRVLRWGLGALAGGLMLALGLGYLGWLHPAGDSFAVFRPQGALALMLVAGVGFMAGARKPALLALVVAGVTGGPLIAAWRATQPPGDLVLYQKNVLFRNAELPALAADIRAAAPDILTLQEVSEENLAMLAGLADILPHQLFCAYSRVGDVAVATHLTPVPGAEICGPGLAAMQVEAPGGKIWLVSVHVSWPWPYRQAAHLERVLPIIEGLDGPVIIAGDFNMVGWSAALARVRAAAGVRAAGPVIGTYAGFEPWVSLPIDHVMAPSGGSMTLRPLAGGDHWGLLARVGL